MEITGVVNNGTVVLDQPSSIPDGTKVVIQVLDQAKRTGEGSSASLGKRLLKHAATVPGLPADLSEQHDHYLHGTPKR
jgi:hypothetical protein